MRSPSGQPPRMSQQPEPDVAGRDAYRGPPDCRAANRSQVQSKPRHRSKERLRRPPRQEPPEVQNPRSTGPYRRCAGRERARPLAGDCLRRPQNSRKCEGRYKYAKEAFARDAPRPRKTWPRAMDFSTTLNASTGKPQTQRKIAPLISFNAGDGMGLDLAKSLGDVPHPSRRRHLPLRFQAYIKRDKWVNS